MGVEVGLMLGMWGFVAMVMWVIWDSTSQG
jgi:hypothetical protein